jgi:TPP-dependent pyruvate/acetoin dehydrogenase alpha subunit
VIGNLDPGRDVVFSNHRCHGHYLAFTDDLFGLLSEVMGKATGVCGGKGGSQHLCNGNFYSNGVQGSIVPVATGIALGMAKRGGDAITTVFLGDGTMGEGTVYECLNMASLWRLPLLFVVENNGYAQSTPRSLAVAGDIAERARPFGVEATELTTTDVTEIAPAAARIVERIRTTGSPHFLVLNTYRLAPHSKGDDHRDPAEIEEQRRFDPLAVAAAKLPESRRRTLDDAAERRVAEALAAAEQAPAAAPGP